MNTHRDGFTFVELLLVLVIGLLVVGAAYGTLVRQEQAYGMFSAISETQQNTRTGIELLSAELREVSPAGADLLMATPDSLEIRAVRKFGILCATNKTNKKLTVSQVGTDAFDAGDSLFVYVDGDSLVENDDTWQTEYVSNASSSSCTGILGSTLASLLPGGNTVELTVGNALRFDSVFPGAPVRSFETVTYRTGTWDGMPMLMRDAAGATAPLVGPLTTTDGLELRYYDTLGLQMTSFPLDSAARAAVERIQLRLRAERQAGSTVGIYQDSLVTDIYLRGG